MKALLSCLGTNVISDGFLSLQLTEKIPKCVGLCSPCVHVEWKL